MAKQNEISRCLWAAKSTELMQHYHDHEWGVPEYDSRALWEKLSLDGFQAGLSWSTILNKRDAFRKAFANFDPKKVSVFGEKDILRLLKDEGIIRSRAKIEATITGAKVFCQMAENGEDFSDFCWGFMDGKVMKSNGIDLPANTELSEKIAKELKRRGFKFCGPTITYAWMQAVGMVNDHSLDCFRRNEVSNMPLRKPRDFESLHIQVESDTALKPSEPDQFVSEFKISLLDIDEDGSDVLVGLLGVFKVSREEAGEREIKLFDVCNSHSDELLECYEALFAKGESDCLLNPKAQAILGRPFAPSFVFVDFIAFAPEYEIPNSPPQY